MVYNLQLFEQIKYFLKFKSDQLNLLVAPFCSQYKKDLMQSKIVSKINIVIKIK